MLLQTNSYIVPADKRTEHARLVKRFRQVMSKLGCDDFEVYQQAGPNWTDEAIGRFVQIMKFRDREHQRALREAEQSDPDAQELVREFCEMINFPYQHQQGLATTAFYIGVVSGPPTKRLAGDAREVPGVVASELKPVEGSDTPAPVPTPTPTVRAVRTPARPPVSNG
jgi:hypothetical protein